MHFHVVKMYKDKEVKKTVTHLDIATYQISSQYIKGRQEKVWIT
jgi:hypothetical protein